MKKLIFILSGIITGLHGIAQTIPQQVSGNYQMPLQDIAYGTVGSLGECIALGNSLVFVADDQLWITDGSVNGTQMLKQYVVDDSVRPTGLTLLNDKIYFFADDGILGNELWVTDGTSAGTNLVKDIKPGATASVNNKYPIANHVHYNIQKLNNKLFFIADDGMYGDELWSSDGTAGGTSMFYDSYAGPSGGAFTHQNILSTNSKLFFTALGYSGPDTFFALYATDGTLANTVIINDSVYLGHVMLLPFNDKVIFSTNFVTHNIKVSDGTQAGTHTIVPGQQSSYDIAVLNNRAYFFSGVSPASANTLMTTDGTLAGTYVIRQSLSIQPTLMDNNNRYPSHSLTTLDQKLLFSANGGTGEYQEIWVSDGTPSGTNVLKDILATDTLLNHYSSWPSHFTNFNGKVYFKATDSSGYNLWHTDGTTGNTLKVDMPGANFHDLLSWPYLRKFLKYPMVSAGNALYFYALYDTTLGPRIYKLDLFPVGIDNEHNIFAIDIYPNPSQGYINVDAEHAIGISIHNIAGAVVYHKELSGNEPVHKADVHQFATGTYTITSLLSDGTKRYGKFVKQ